MKKDRIDHFSNKDIILSFFGALIVASGFLFKGKFIEVSVGLDDFHILMIFIATMLILSAEIYLLGYSRVRNKRERPFGQFLVKRVMTIYCMSLVVSMMIIVLYDLTMTITDVTLGNVFHLVISAAFPSSIGAALTDLFKKF